jgi:ADP-heptose:LPS heptosyltransferase
MPDCDCDLSANGRKRSDIARLGILRAAGGVMRLIRRKRVPYRPSSPRVLLIRPDHIGDLLLTTPSVEILRKALPSAHITMMVGPWAEEVARRDSLLDEIAVCSFPGFTREAPGRAWEPYRLLLSVATELSRHSYYAALVMRFDHWWGAWLAAAAGIPMRAGIDTPETRPFLTHVLPVEDGAHWAARSIKAAERLLEAWGLDLPEADERPGLRFPVRPEEVTAADELLAGCAFPEGTRLAVIHPGSGAALKSWPADRWAELGRRLAATGAGVILTGPPGEAGMAEKIGASIPGSRCLAGRTSLGTLAALFKRCALVAGVDSGPLHLAVAVDTPSLRLYGPTDPAVFGPWGDAARHRSITGVTSCAPCSRLDLSPRDGESPACMRSITLERVESACRELLLLDRSAPVSTGDPSLERVSVPEEAP